mmetsp:Transcript_69713/g.167354  ORF Transcript_69713/g.167354 Transcript_69713/m.167354 type:complete len:242 (+) Transcript_69713:351-1076(+)
MVTALAFHAKHGCVRRDAQHQHQCSQTHISPLGATLIRVRILITNLNWMALAQGSYLVLQRFLLLLLLRYLLLFVVQACLQSLLGLLLSRLCLFGCMQFSLKLLSRLTRLLKRCSLFCHVLLQTAQLILLLGNLGISRVPCLASRLQLLLLLCQLLLEGRFAILIIIGLVSSIVLCLLHLIGQVVDFLLQVRFRFLRLLLFLGIGIQLLLLLLYPGLHVVVILGLLVQLLLQLCIRSLGIF